MFASNRYGDRYLSYRFGTVEIRLGDDATAYNSVNSKVYGPVYDGGFFPIGNTFNGRYLTLRRIYISPALPISNDFDLCEVRAYQVPNLL